MAKILAFIFKFDSLKKLPKYFFVCLVFFIITACHTNKQYTSKPTKSLVNPDSDLLEVNALAFHLNDSSTRIYLELKNENLLYKREDTSKAFYSDVKLVYRLVSEINSKIILDSGSYYIKDKSEDEYVKLKSLTSAFKLRARAGYNYYLDLEMFDINRKVKYSQGLSIYKKNSYSAQNYLVTVRDTICFKNNFLKNDKVLVKFANTELKQVSVQGFFKEQGPALPPFSTKETEELSFKEDTTFTLQLSTNQFMLSMPERGFYHISADTKNTEGLNLFTYPEYYPGVSSSDEMISCTRYIMSKDEFETCKSATDQKVCIDNFWLNIAGSNERARELLKRYYGRVKEANKNYTSFTQGWKTDRGMVFIIFGAPTNIYRSKKDEVWVYGNEANPNGLRFIFNKKINPYSDNHFIMERSQFYKDNWYTAVEMWRQGLIYSEGSR